MSVCLKRTPELMAMVADLVGSGTPITHAAQACGIGRDSIYRWLDSDETFATEIKRRRSQAVHERVEIIRQASSKQWTAAAWYLERQYPQEFGLKQPETNIAVKVEIRDCSRDSAPQIEVVECKLIEE